METTEILSEKINIQSSSEISEQGKLNLATSAKWMNFVGITVITLYSLIILGLIGAFIFGMSTTSGIFRLPIPAMIFAILLYGGIIGLFIWLWTLVVRQSRAIKNFIKGGPIENLELSFKYQKLFWKTSGILTIVFLSLYLIYFLIIGSVAAFI